MLTRQSNVIGMQESSDYEVVCNNYFDTETKDEIRTYSENNHLEPMIHYRSLIISIFAEIEDDGNMKTKKMIKVLVDKIYKIKPR